MLVVTGQLASVVASLPPLSYSVWMIDFQFGCLLFNIISFSLYAAVNFGMQVRHRAMAHRPWASHRMQLAGRSRTALKPTHSY